MSLYTRIIARENLKRAWEKVKKNKPAPGVDQITWEEFEANQEENIENLHIELSEKRFCPQKVKLVVLQKGDKTREVTICSMRDKIVQKSLADELTRIYEPYFPNSSFAYRAGKSALQAVEYIEEQLIRDEYQYFFKGDVAHFFDSISLSVLREKLTDQMIESEVMDLLFSFLTVSGLDEQGEIIEKREGVYQG